MKSFVFVVFLTINCSNKIVLGASIEPMHMLADALKSAFPVDMAKVLSEELVKAMDINKKIFNSPAGEMVKGVMDNMVNNMAGMTDQMVGQTNNLVEDRMAKGMMGRMSPGMNDQMVGGMNHQYGGGDSMPGSDMLGMIMKSVSSMVRPPMGK